MRKRLSRFAVASLPLSALLVLLSVANSGPASSSSSAEDQYIGASKCKNCHSAPESGNQYETWTKAKHSHAFETLVSSAAAKEAAAARGIDDPSTADACLKCHTTGFGEPETAFARGWKQDAGVQCETCHGHGSAHMKERFKAAASGKKAEGYEGIAVQEMVVSPGVDVCVRCHNPESPSYQNFCYYEARGKIAHLDPRKPRTEEEVASYGTCPHGSPCPHGDGCPDGTCNLKPDALAAMKKK